MHLNIIPVDMIQHHITNFAVIHLVYVHLFIFIYQGPISIISLPEKEN